MIRGIPVLLAAAALLAGTIGTPALAASRGHRTASPPGYLQSDGGTGNAMSLAPRTDPRVGTPVYAYPQASATPFEQNVAGGQCNQGKVSVSPPCPWTGAAASLDKTYAGHPIYSYFLFDSAGLCAGAASNKVVLGLCPSGRKTRANQEWVPEDNTGAASGAILNVAMTQQAAGRRVMCDNGDTTQMTTTPTGGCPSGRQDWAFNDASAGN